jgi:hypothetical protein
MLVASMLIRYRSLACTVDAGADQVGEARQIFELSTRSPIANRNLPCRGAGLASQGRVESVTRWSGSPVMNRLTRITVAACHRFRAPWRGCPYRAPGLVELCRCGSWAWKDGQDTDPEHGRSQTTEDAFAGHGPFEPGKLGCFGKYLFPPKESARPGTLSHASPERPPASVHDRAMGAVPADE